MRSTQRYISPCTPVAFQYLNCGADTILVLPLNAIVNVNIALLRFDLHQRLIGWLQRMVVASGWSVRANAHVAHNGVKSNSILVFQVSISPAYWTHTP